MDYATLYWLRHLEAGLTSSSSAQHELHGELTESLELFVERHWNSPTSDIRSAPGRMRDVLETFKSSRNYDQIRKAIVLTDQELKNYGDVRPNERALDLSSIVSSIRSILEKLFENNSDQGVADDVAMKYGNGLFKCPRFSCKHFTEGFTTSDKRNRHINQHERPARCTDESCRGSQIGFPTKAQLERHLRESHPDTAEPIQTFPTEEEVDESVRENNPEPEREAVVVTEVIADPPLPLDAPYLPVALDRDNDAPQSRQPRETTKRQKTKRDYECKHCNKIFTKKYNLQSHLDTHNTDRIHACPHCNVTCARASDLTRHMKSHDSESAATCMGCRKVYARADVLRSHHKSKKGRQCIATIEDSVQAGPSGS